MNSRGSSVSPNPYSRGNTKSKQFSIRLCPFDPDRETPQVDRVQNKGVDCIADEQGRCVKVLQRYDVDAQLTTDYQQPIKARKQIWGEVYGEVYENSQTSIDALNQAEIEQITIETVESRLGLRSRIPE